jgi:hypothetical protein
MEWIDFSGKASFVAFHAAEGGAPLSGQLANDEDIDKAATELKRQIDSAARQMKAALQEEWEFSPYA